MAKKEQQFCRNAEQLARAFGLSLAPRKRKASLSQALAWTKAPDFPEKTRVGWPLELVRLWKELRDLPQKNAKSAEQLPLIPEKLRERIEFLTDLFINPEKNERKIAKFEIDELRQYRADLFHVEHAEGGGRGAMGAGNGTNGQAAAQERSPAGAGAETFCDANGRLLDSESQKALAMRLSLHFQGRTSIDISEQQISRWKTSAQDLPEGVPPPPPKLGNRWSTQLWAEWFERWMLPHYRYQPKTQGTLAGTDLAAESRAAEQREKIWREGQEKIKYQAASGQYISAEKARLARRGALKIIHSLWRRALENEDCRLRQDWLKEWLGPAKLLEWVEFDKGLAQRRVDFVEGEYARALAGEPEKQIAKEAAGKT